MKNTVKTILFLCITAAVFALLGKVLTPKWVSPNTYGAADCLYSEPDNTLEVLILGGSVSSYAISPMELYEDYGICSYNFGSSRQPMLVSYAWLQETYKSHSESLKVLVLEPALLCNTSSVNESHYTKGLTYLKMSDIKLKAYLEHYGTYSGVLEALSAMYNYHTRWTKLSRHDFTDSALPLQPYLKGWNNYYTRYLDSNDYNKLAIINGKYLEGQESYILDTESLYYYNKILAFCNSHDIKLLLAKMPNNVSESIWSSAKYNAVASLAEESGVEYLDYNFSPLYDRLDYNSVLDGRDTAHTNVWGASKITSDLGQYLVDHYDLTDVRNDPDYAFLKDQLEDYHTNVEALKDFYMITDPTEYLSKAMSEENAYITFIVAQGDAASGLTDEQRSAFMNSGLNKLASLTGTSPYLAVIENGKVTEMTAEAYSSEGLSLSGTACDGKVYTLLSAEEDASISVNYQNNSTEEDGLFFVLYNPEYSLVLTSDLFPTGTAPGRDRRDYEAELKEARINDLPFSQYSEGLKKYTLYQRRKDTALILEDLGDTASMIDLVRAFKPLDHMRIFIVDGGGSFDSLTEDDRRLFSYIGLFNLAACEKGDAYIGVIESGRVIFDLRDSSGKPLTLEKLDYRLSSGPVPDDTGLIQTISNTDYTISKKGIYVYIFDELLEKVICKSVFRE